MFAIIEIAGHQHKVAQGDILEIEKLKDYEDGDKVVADAVLLKSDDKKVEIGTPYLEDSKVEFKVLEGGRGEKIRIFKKKPKKRFERTQGHRQSYTKIEILSVK
ncbi:50S ribosomal protein L21 [Candidatus Peregrinibacteria bacterium CG_4_10_14_0_2_um_filter_43_11]|nr:MAG: 50S ribosomal protein L21 [Candidatus Peregrinibacteria bacterium CG_4_10_14_0_2_um_filter_43_11]